MPITDFEAIEGLLHELLSLADCLFTDEENKEVQDFIDAGEYGLALQTFADVVGEQDKKIPGRAVAIAEELANLMDMSGEIDLESIRCAVY